MACELVSIVCSEPRNVYNRVDPRGMREIELVGYSADTAEDGERSVVMFCQLRKGTTVNCVLPIRLEAQPHHLPSFKGTVFSLLICLGLHFLFTAIEVFFEVAENLLSV